MSQDSTSALAELDTLETGKHALVIVKYLINIKA